MNSWILPMSYRNWVADFKLAPDCMVRIITMDGRTFTVKIRKVGSSYFFHDGWSNMIDSLILPKNSLLLFQYEGSLILRLIYFYQDLSFAQGDFLYCQSSRFSEHIDHLVIILFVIFKFLL
ncbi:putative transcription factor B3-Domain family [Helianthus debilis subsp. tardiflorus]